MVISLKWEQVNAWRLSQQGLSHRLQRGELVQAVRQTIGIHAQLMSAAEMSIGARMDGISPQDVQSALWQEHTLVKTWVMRQTLHLIPATDFPIYIAARRLTDINWPALFNRYGINRAVFETYLAISPEILNNGPLTRQQFTGLVGERLNSPELRDFLTKHSWGTPLKPLAWHGELCCGPNIGQNVTFVRPSAWIGAWREMDPEAAMQEVVRRYLMVYGPARPRNFQWWWWMSSRAAKKAFDSIADETEEVDVEGWRSTALKASVLAMLELEPTGEVHLLPSFDAYTVGLARGKNLERLITLEHQKKVYRLQGWVSAVVLVDGFIKGTWEYKVQRSKTTVTVDLFSSISNKVKEGIANEAARLGKFLNTTVQLEFK